MNRSVLLQRSLFAICLLLFSGCEESGPRRGDVEGRITVDSEPIESGAIVFTPLEGVEGAPMQYEIRDSVYSSSDRGVPIGKNSVFISGTKPAGTKSLNFVTGEMSEDYVEIVPAKYNERTTLEVDVVEGDNTLNFTLDGKPKR